MSYFQKTFQSKSKLKKILRLSGLLVLFFVLAGFLFVLGIFIFFAKDLPRPEIFSERQQVLPTRIYDRTGETLLRTIYQEEKRSPIKLEQVPKHLIDALLATEDTNFYQHKGVDLKGIARAILVDLQLKEPAQGASTISQQLIRSTYLTLEKTVQRKVREIVLTLELERRYDKNQILEWYINQIPLGPNIYGVGEAAKTYFDKEISELTLSESAIIVSLIKAPSHFYPFGENVDKLQQRKNYVLARMEQEGFIDKETLEKTRNEELKFAEQKKSLILAPHFTLYIESYLLQKYGIDFLSKNGLKVYTTLDLEMQKEAEEIIKKGVETNKNYNSYNASLVAITPYNGEIIAMVGSKDYFSAPYPEGCNPGLDCKFEPRVNVAIYGEGQQPGSAFKPFIYATAFKEGYSPNSIVVDEKTNFGLWGDKDYIPQNYDGRYRGAVTYRQALAQSLNIPAIKVLLRVGIEDALQTAHDMGITTLNRGAAFYGPSLVLGAGEVKLLDMVSAYGVFANQGLRIPPTAILKIEDENGNIIETGKATPRRVLSESVCENISDILSDNNSRAPMFGRYSQLYFPAYPKVASKTGTTDGFRDAWAIGYNQKISVGVWTGNNDNSSTAKKPGLVMAGPIWHQFMEFALNKLEPK
jgi:1A family penicillin-binding protein